MSEKLALFHVRCYIGSMPRGENIDAITFYTVNARKRAAKAVAGVLDMDLTTLLNSLIDEKVAEVFPQLMKEIEEQDPKARSRRQALKKAG